MSPNRSSPPQTASEKRPDWRGAGKASLTLTGEELTTHGSQIHRPDEPPQKIRQGRREGALTLPLAFLFAAILWLAGISCLDPDPGFAAQPVEIPWRQVAAEMEDLVAADPDNIEYVFRLAVAYANLGRIDESANTFIRAGEIDQERVYAEKLIALYQPQFEAGRLDLREMNYLAFAYYSEEQYEKACRIFYKVIEADPANEWPRNYLGFSLFKADRLDEAIPVLQKAVRLNPSNEYSHFLLGMAYYYKGWYFRAVGEAARAPHVIKKFFK